MNILTLQISDELGFQLFWDDIVSQLGRQLPEPSEDTPQVSWNPPESRSKYDIKLQFARRYEPFYPGSVGYNPVINAFLAP